MLNRVCALGLVVGAWIGSASAQEHAVDDRWLLAKYDANGDRVITSTEVEHKRTRVFHNMDLDNNGEVSLKEYESLDMQRRQPLIQARFSKLDENGDGNLSGAEYASYLGSFDRLDKNGDGQVSKHEISKKRKSKKDMKHEADMCLLWVCLRSNIK